MLLDASLVQDERQSRPTRTGRLLQWVPFGAHRGGWRSDTGIETSAAIDRLVGEASVPFLLATGHADRS